MEDFQIYILAAFLVVCLLFYLIILALIGALM